MHQMIQFVQQAARREQDSFVTVHLYVALIEWLTVLPEQISRMHLDKQTRYVMFSLVLDTYAAFLLSVKNVSHFSTVAFMKTTHLYSATM
jgi:hypothetical protein